jgi:outer membrane protein TolC
MPPRSAWPSGLLLALLPLVACASPQEYREEADEEVYELVLERRAELFGQDGDFSIDPPEDSLRQRALRGEIDELPALDLAACLDIAAENSRDFQRQKEQLYLAALDLTLERWRFGWQFDGSLDATVNGTGEEAGSANAGGDLGLSRLLGTGAQIVGNIGTSLFRALSTGDGWDALSSISLSVSQPLLRGSAREVVMEPLTQAERDLVYQVRTFERYRRTFAVDIANRYFRLLQTRDSVENEQRNFANLAILRARNEALAEAGQMSDMEAAEARSDELSSENRLLDLQQNYERSLDDFKIFLGLPPELVIDLDAAPLAGLSTTDELGLVLMAEEDLVAVALERRLDFLNEADQFVDAERRVRLAEDALRMGLDVTASVGSSSEEGRPLAFRSDGTPWSVGLRADLPIDQLPERNSYRSALISLENVRRNLELTEDRIRADLREALRQLRTSEMSYLIQETSVTTNEARLESALLRQEAGRSDTQEVLRAQESLLAAQNARTRAKIDLALTRYDFFTQLEVLHVAEDGIEIDEAALPEPAAPAEE